MIISFFQRYRSWDGYGREMSESGSDFRHGTLRWTYAPRSKPPLPTAVHPQQIWQSAPIVWPWPITDNGSPPEPPPQRPNWSCTQSCGLRSEESCGMLMNTHDMTCQLSCSMTAQTDWKQCESFSFSSVSPFKNVNVRSPCLWIWFLPCIIPSRFLRI